MADQAAVLRHPLMRMLLELGESSSDWRLQRARQPKSTNACTGCGCSSLKSAWSSSCCRTSTGCAPDDGAEAVAKRFQQFLDANGKTLQQQGAADADLNAVLDFFAASRASASGPGDATAMAGACEPGASQAIAWHSQLCTLVC